MTEHARFISIWERGGADFEREWKGYQNLKKLYTIPLRVAFREIRRSEMGEGGVLSLGIGSGLAEEMAGINSRQITGLEVNRSLIRQARSNLPGVRIVEGLMENGITRVGHFPYAFASDSLCSINPRDLSSFSRALRQKVDKLVIVQALPPAGTFYVPHAMKLEEAGPGPEGWTEAQQDSVSQMLRENGITHPANERWSLINDVQTRIETTLGASFPVRMADFLDRAGFLYHSALSFPDITYPAQICVLLGSMEVLTAVRKKAYSDEVVKSPQDEVYGRYVSMAAASELMQVFMRSLMMDYYFKLVSDALREAGFTNVQEKSIAIVGKEITTKAALGVELNRSLEFINSRSIPASTHNIQPQRVFLVEGADVEFVQPSNEPRGGLHLRYLVAA